MTQKDRMHAMLQDIVDHFSKDPVELRSKVSEGTNCYYHPPKDKPKSIGCAIGMYVGWKDAKKLDLGGSDQILQLMGIPRKAKLIPKWMKNLPGEFLFKCQSLHDVDYHWTDTGISHEGEELVGRICNQFQLPKIVIPK